MAKRSGGFSLIETLVSIVILGAMVVPTCTALVMSIRLNDKTEKMLQAQLAVSSAVETMMATGFAPEMTDDFDGVKIEVDEDESVPGTYYRVTVSDIPDEGDALVAVTTTIRAAEPATEGGTGE